MSLSQQQRKTLTALRVTRVPKALADYIKAAGHPGDDRRWRAIHKSARQYIRDAACNGEVMALRDSLPAFARRDLALCDWIFIGWPERHGSNVETVLRIVGDAGGHRHIACAFILVWSRLTTDPCGWTALESITIFRTVLHTRGKYHDILMAHTDIHPVDMRHYERRMMTPDQERTDAVINAGWGHQPVRFMRYLMTRPHSRHRIQNNERAAADYTSLIPAVPMRRVPTLVNGK